MTSVHNSGNSSCVFHSSKTGQIGSKEVAFIPSSHSEADHKLKIILLVAAAIFIGSILFWAIGASAGSPGLQIIGKVFFGLSISAIGIALCALFAGGIFLCNKA